MPNNIIIVSSKFTESEALIQVFNQVQNYSRFKHTAFIIVPALNEAKTFADYQQVLAHRVNTLSFKKAIENVFIQKNTIYFLPNNIIVSNNTFVAINASNDEAQQSLDKAVIRLLFWKHIGQEVGFNTAVIALYPDESERVGLNHIMENGGITLLHQKQDTDITFLRSYFTYILPIRNILSKISSYFGIDHHDKSPALSLAVNPQSTQVLSNTTTLSDSNNFDLSEQLNQMVINNFMPLVLFVNHNGKLVHKTGGQHLYRFFNVRLTATTANNDFDPFLQYPKHSLTQQIQRYVKNVLTAKNNKIVRQFVIQENNIKIKIEVQRIKDEATKYLLAMVHIVEIPQLIEVDNPQTPANENKSAIAANLYNENLLPATKNELVINSNEKSAPPVKIDDLFAFIDSDQISLLVLDNQLNIQRFSRSLKEQLQLTGIATGQNLSDFAQVINFPDLINGTKEALRNESMTELLLDYLHHQRSFVVRIWPYYRYKSNNRGILISFTNNINYEEANKRLDLSIKELQKQGVGLLEANLSLKKEAELKEQMVQEIEKQRILQENILLSMSEGVLATNSEGLIVLKNNTIDEVLGQQHFFNKLCDWVEQQQFYYPLERKKIPAEYNPFLRALNGQEVVNQEVLMISNNDAQKKEVYLNINARPYNIDDYSSKTGNTIQATGSVLVISDISNRKKVEIQLTKSEEKNKALIDAIPDTLFTISREGVYSDYRSAYSNEIDQIPAAAFVGNNIKDLWLGESAADAFKHLQRAFKYKKLETYTFGFQNKSKGRMSFLETRFVAINKQEALGITRDITALELAKESLQKTANYYNRLLQSNPIPLIIINQKGVFEQVNPAFRELVHIDKQDNLSEKNIYHFIHKKSVYKIREMLSNAFKGDLVAKPMEILLKLSNTAEPIIVETRGNIVTMRGKRVMQLALRDITLEKAQNNSLGRSEKKYQTIFNQTTNGIAIVDVTDNKSLSVNKPLLAMLACKTQRSFLRKNFTHFLHIQQPNSPLDGKAYWAKHIAKAKKQRKEYQFALHWKANTGIKPIATQVKMLALKYEGKNIWMLVVELI